MMMTPQSRCLASSVPETAASPAAGEGSTVPGAVGDSGSGNCHLLLIYLGGQVGRPPLCPPRAFVPQG